MMTMSATPIHQRDYATESRRSFDRRSDSIDPSSEMARPSSSHSARGFGQSPSSHSLSSFSQATPKASAGPSSASRALADAHERGGFVEDSLGFDFLLGPAPASNTSSNGRAFAGANNNTMNGNDFSSRPRAFSPGRDRRVGLAFMEEEDESSGHSDRRSSDDSSVPGSYDNHGGQFGSYQHAYPFRSGREGLSSSSVASSGGATSPLSPHVEPFSPATSATGSSAAWPVNHVTKPVDVTPDARTVTSAQPFSQRTQSFSHDQLMDRRMSALALSDSTNGRPANAFSVLSSNPFDESQPQGPYSSTMTASGSRDTMLARRELQADRGGYVRANYSTEAASRNYMAAPPASDYGAEEISTIFVVGFPDDMLEREFQNMFLFADGFEAATLKVPAGTFAARELREREKQGHDPYGGMLGDAIYDDAFDFPGSIPFETTLPPLLGPNPPRDRAASPAPIRKQTIGFARFRTRAQALQARDMLSGKRVDAEKGSMLKAEMAKKNLHTKRSQEPGTPVYAEMSAQPRTSYESYSREAETRQREAWEDSQQSTAAMSAPSFASSHLASSQRSFSRERSDGVPAPLEQQQSPVLAAMQSQSSPPSARSSVIQPFDAAGSKSMHQQLDNATPAFASPPLQAVDRLGNGEDRSAYSFANQQTSYGLPPAAGTGGRQPLYPASAYAAAMPPLNAHGVPRTTNPADMNSPKNTLYVGGLPSVLPSLTGPFSAAHLEDSLRNAFARCQGFKRLCFRSKSNGPIVFVEFEDVAYATRALQDMYGHTLGGLVKGGIRLSYSKNPLGVRSTTGSSSPSPSHSTFAPQQIDPYQGFAGSKMPPAQTRQAGPFAAPAPDGRGSLSPTLNQYGSTFSPFA